MKYNNIKKYFKIIGNWFSIIMLVIIINYPIHAQNCNIECDELLLNTKLEIDPPNGWPLSSSEDSGASFNFGYVPDWSASHGSPHHCQIVNGEWDCGFTSQNYTEVNGISIF